MVGVPGRSKGCSTCRARKKRCDLQQPICGNCIKGSYHCGGYTRNMIVVEANPAKKGTGIYKPQTTSLVLKKDFMKTLPELPSPPSDISCRSMNRSALEAQCFDGFWSLYLPEGIDQSDYLGYSIVFWGQLTQSMVHKSDLVRCALLTMSMSKMGQSNADNAMVQQGMALYGKTLSRVASALRNPAKQDKNELIVTCRMLAMYEQLNNSSHSAVYSGSVPVFLRHVDGIGKIIQLYSPADYGTSWPNMEMFLEYRLTQSMAAIASRKSSFLAKGEWMWKPWALVGKSPWDRINDIHLELSTICEKTDLFMAAKDGSDVFRSGEVLLQSCWKMDKRLQDWYEHLFDRFEFAHFLTQDDIEYLQTGIGRGPPDRLAEIFVKGGIGSLFHIAMYASAYVVLHHNMIIIASKYPNSSFGSTLGHTEPEGYIQDFALCVARCVKYFVSRDCGLAGPMVMAIPLACLGQYYYAQKAANGAVAQGRKVWEIEQIWNELSSSVGGAWVAKFLTELHNLYPQPGMGTPSPEKDLKRTPSAEAGSTSAEAYHVVPIRASTPGSDYVSP